MPETHIVARLLDWNVRSALAVEEECVYSGRRSLQARCAGWL
jgi:hypothetical protein